MTTVEQTVDSLMGMAWDWAESWRRSDKRIPDEKARLLKAAIEAALHAHGSVDAAREVGSVIVHLRQCADAADAGYLDSATMPRTLRAWAATLRAALDAATVARCAPVSPERPDGQGVATAMERPLTSADIPPFKAAMQMLRRESYNDGLVSFDRVNDLFITALNAEYIERDAAMADQEK